MPYFLGIRSASLFEPILCSLHSARLRSQLHPWHSLNFCSSDDHWPRIWLHPHTPTAAGTASSRREKGPLLQALPPPPTPTLQLCISRQSRILRGSSEAAWHISWRAVAQCKGDYSAPFQRQLQGSLSQETSMVRGQFEPFESWQCRGSRR